MANVYVRSGAAGAANGSDWANAYTTLAAALAAKAAGDDFWVSEDHSETTAGAVALVSPGTAANPCRVICVDHLGSVPPVSADLRTTAAVSNTGSNNITFTGFAYCYGIIFTAGNTTATSDMIWGTNTFWSHKSCSFVLGGSNSGSEFRPGNNTTTRTIWDNCTVQFAATTQSINMATGGTLHWKNTTSAIAGANIPTNLFSVAAQVSTVVLEGVDLSAMGSGKNIVGAGASALNVIFKDCKLGASVTICATPTAQTGPKVVATRCDSSGTNNRTEKYGYEGTQVVDTTVVHTGGASDGTTALSWKLTATANAKWYAPFDSLPVVVWNATTGANITVTVEGLQDPRTSTSLPNNDDIWFEVEYLGSASSPLGSFKSGTKEDALASGTALTASTQAWDSNVTARANSTAYSVGDVRKVASNPGRVFVCTTAGTSAGSEPGGYATAVDGDSISDGTATFKAAVRFKQSIVLTSPQPGLAGYLTVIAKVAKTSGIFYVDPKIALS